jgi:hypothetical protein
LDKGKVVGSELVVARRHPTTLFDPVEEPLDLVASAIKIRAEADRIAAIAFRRDIGPRAFFHGKLSDPETRMAIVLSGTLYYANGDQWDESKFKAYPPGSFLIEPAKISHYAMARDDEVVLQATSIGPSSTVRIEQAKK